ncbi:MAG: transglycosylase domain-containing protein [Anaerolineales bacterium]
MSSTLTIVRQRRKRREHRRRSVDGRARQTFFGLGFVATTLLVVLLLTTGLAYADLTRDLPSLETLPILLDPQTGLLRQPTRLYDRSGTHLLRVLAPADAPRTFLPYNRFPQACLEATIAVAEPAFWRSPGYRLAGWRDPTTHPTIAQQLVSDLLLWNEPPSIRRALRERLLAGQLVARYGRAQVLEWYLNSADYGNHAYGAEAAAQLYFGKSVTALGYSECAMLAAVAAAPALNPVDAPQAAEQRRQETLRAMLALGLLTPDELNRELGHLPVLMSYPESEPPFAPAFVSLSLAQLESVFGGGRVERGGLIVITSLDYDLQVQAACAVQAQVARLTGEGEAPESGCVAARLLPPLPALPPLPDASASALILDPRRGQVLSAVGDTYSGGESAALLSHPAGTVLTPFIYLTAFTRGFSPASLGWDIPGAVANFDGQYRGPVRLRLALVNDYLPPAARLLDQFGSESVRRLSEPFGLVLPPDADLLSGNVSVSPLDLAGAYAIFAAEGQRAGQVFSDQTIRPSAVLTVTGVDGAIWGDWSTARTQSVVSPELTYLMTHVLSDEIARWPSLGRGNPLEVGFPAGVKQGNFASGTSAWTVGYTPDRVVVVWVDGGKGSGMQAASGGLWNALLRQAAASSAATWETPAGIVTRSVCDPSGLLPTDACPNVVTEVFLAGSEPVQADTLYRAYEINRETGLLATIFTPPELIERRVYLMVPAEARPWAEGQGLPVPPTAYDSIQPQPPLAEAHLTSPELFADVHGEVLITGAATGEGFVSYRLEYGQGLNPSTWIQIGSDRTEPVIEGRLAVWETGGLNGLYALRLLVVYEGQRVRQAVTQVVVDNTPPQVAILYPRPGQEVDSQTEPQVLFQVQASDPYLAQVTFYLDGRRLTSLTSEPFTFSWTARRGEHTLRAVAADRVGNTAEAELEFTVNP